MKENSRCSILFHLLVPGGKWQTVISSPVSSASLCSSSFQRRTLAPLLPPESAVISNLPALGYAAVPIDSHHRRMLWAAKAAVSIHAHADPARVLRHIVNSVGSRAPEFRNHEIVHPHLLGSALRSQFPATVLEVAHQLFLLGIHGNDRLAVGLKFPNLAADMVKLRVPIRVSRSLQGLAIGLQAVVTRMQKFCHHAMARVVPCALEFGGQLPHALASPPQRRLRVTASHRTD